MAASSCLMRSPVSCKWESLADVSADESAFNGIQAEAILYVPTGTKSIYLAKAPWNGFSNISEKDFGVGIYNVETGKGVTITIDGGVITVSGAGSSAVTLYSLTGEKKTSASAQDKDKAVIDTSNLPQGIYVVQSDNATTKVLKR